MSLAPDPLSPDLSPEVIDALYHPGSGVTDTAAEVRHYAEASAAARSQRRHVVNQRYGPTQVETLDIFPADTPGAPVFVFLHGGYWRALSSKDFSCVALGPQARGITTVVVDYALCPLVTIDEIVRQIRTALAWVVRNIAAHGGDPARVAVGGHSAGAHLSAMALQTEWSRDWDLPSDPLRAALLVSGVYDIAPLQRSYLQPHIQLDAGIVQRNSPLHRVRPCATPSLVTWGGLESAAFARQSGAYADACESHGQAIERWEQAGEHHFSVIHGLEQPDSRLCDWLARQLGAGG